MTELAKCPHCKKTTFVRISKDVVVVRFDKHGLVDEQCKNEGYEYWCRNCGHDITDKFELKEVKA